MAGLTAKIEVFLKAGVLDVQGKAVEAALHGLGWPGASDVRVGRVITLALAETDPAAAQAQATAMCDRLLANAVIERYDVSVS